MTLEQRRLDFISEVHTTALNKYSDEMLVEFIEYWTELDRNKKKMRFEAQKFFSMGRRLSTWARNEKKWNTPRIMNTNVNDAKTVQSNFLKERYGIT